MVELVETTIISVCVHTVSYFFPCYVEGHSRRHPELGSGSIEKMLKQVQHDVSSLKLRRKDGNIREYLQPYVENRKTLLSEGLYHCLVRKCGTHENPGIVKERKR